VNDYFDATKNAANITALWTAIHVTESVKVPKFEMGCSACGAALQPDNMIDYSSDFNRLFERNSPVLIYAGEFDAQDGPYTQEPWLRKLNIPDYDLFWGQARKIYYIWDEELATFITGGYYR